MDAVVHVVVRVGVLLGDAAVGGPARVADAGRGRPRGRGDGAVVGAASTASREVARLPTARTERSSPSSSSEMPAES